jgi:hypothetical protein
MSGGGANLNVGDDIIGGYKTTTITIRKGVYE